MRVPAIAGLPKMQTGQVGQEPKVLRDMGEGKSSIVQKIDNLLVSPFTAARL
jgi:hypothetical protein